MLVEKGEEAAATNANASRFLASCHDEQYEIGTQRNHGGELLAQDEETPGRSVLDGATHIDARLLNIKVASTDGGQVVGEPN